MKKLAIFDFDGTLFDSIGDVVICFNKTLSLHNLPTLTAEEYIPCLGGNIDEIISLVLKDNNTPENLEKIKKDYLNFYNSSKKEKTVPFPDAKGMLEELQEKNVLLAINSNRLNYSLKEFVQKYFDDIDEMSDVLPEEDFFEKLQIRERYEQVVDVIKELDEKYSITLYYRYEKELSAEEIAELMGLSIKTVYTRLERGRRLVLEKLGDENE